MPAVAIPYGRTAVRVEVPDTATVLRPIDQPPLADPATEIAGHVAALAPPRRGERIAVVFPDITRPMPNQVVLPPLLAALEARGATPDDITLLCATGTHRPATPAELEELVGPEVLSRYRVHQHDALDTDGHRLLGTVDGQEILIDRRYAEADVRVTTGFVEPHFFAGWSGGPKGVCPGLAALPTILEAHSPARIADPDATWLELDANPVHRFVTGAVDLLPPDLSIDVAINNDRRITAVFGGPLPRFHRQACEHVRRSALHTVDAPFDVVVAGNTGLPLDRNLYQAVKGMAAAERVVRTGGDIVMLASCVDGFPDDGPFPSLVRSASSAADLAGAERWDRGQDTWQAQVLGRVLAKADVHLYADGLTDDQVRSMHLRPVADPQATVDGLLRRHGPGARICVLPDGPLTVATVERTPGDRTASVVP